MNRRKLTLLLGLLLVAGAYCKAFAEEKIVYRKTSQYATIIVSEDEQGLRILRFDNDPADAQSIVKVGDPDQIEFEYVQVMPVGLALVKEPKRVLVVGLGGGSLPMLLRKHYPKMTIDVVDIDPDIVEVAKKYFGFHEDDSMHVFVEDGRRFIEKCKQPYDIIFLDAYGITEIPYDLATKEFLAATRRATAPNGIVVGNVWSQNINHLHDAMLRTYQEAFDDVYVITISTCGNEIFLALPGKTPLDRADVAKRAAQLSKDTAFRFDIGEYVNDGFRHADVKDPKMRVLLDKDKASEEKKMKEDAEKKEPAAAH